MGLRADVCARPGGVAAQWLVGGGGRAGLPGGLSEAGVLPGEALPR